LSEGTAAALGEEEEEEEEEVLKVSVVLKVSPLLRCPLQFENELITKLDQEVEGGRVCVCVCVCVCV